jgi:hypothetical protein
MCNHAKKVRSLAKNTLGSILMGTFRSFCNLSVLLMDGLWLRDVYPALPLPLPPSLPHDKGLNQDAPCEGG